jgi:hypothetical protein
MIAAWSSN